ncbi:hypothetical protein Focb16_v011192 [Fusarium oxysporum f. sp. cubense]|uniref:Uncharacterized protein n=1 Tax=Fusarium oxysporum f. sp. cubense TaxID=61366 RepID=A0A559KZP5_FUSOC|nr:hypothetical protein Focb16_v011192 [Fusarium oxysporum f. sp. cubense]
MDRLDELGKAIRQDPDPEVPTDTPDAIHKYVSGEIIRRTTGGVVKETNEAIRLPTRMKRADRKQAHISSKPSMPPRQISSYGQRLGSEQKSLGPCWYEQLLDQLRLVWIRQHT